MEGQRRGVPRELYTQQFHPSIHHSVSAPHSTLHYPQTRQICGVPSERTTPIFAAAFSPARSELGLLFTCLLFTCPLAYFPDTWINSSPTVLCCHSSRFPKEEVNFAFSLSSRTSILQRCSNHLRPGVTEESSFKRACLGRRELSG